MIDTIVFDIDGTLADLRHRLKWVSGEEKDWDRFYQDVRQDGVIEPIAELFLLTCIGAACDLRYDIAENTRVICITGRPERTRADTLEWFVEKIGHRPDAIYMRKDHDFRPDVEVKREWVERLRKEGHNIILAFEDRDRVVKMYRDLGIQCCQVAEGTY